MLTTPHCFVELLPMNSHMTFSFVTIAISNTILLIHKFAAIVLGARKGRVKASIYN